MTNKEERKIRKLLGNRFHLCIKYNENLEIDEWHLFRNYDDSKIYFSEDNNEIMSNETNTIEDLMEFAKKHHKIDEHKVIQELIIVIAYFTVIFAILNCFLWKNVIISTTIMAIDLTIILISVVGAIIWDKNWKVDMMELDENYKKRMKELMEEFNEQCDNLGRKNCKKHRIKNND